LHGGWPGVPATGEEGHLRRFDSRSADLSVPVIHLHFHMLFLDGVYVGGGPTFPPYRLAPVREHLLEKRV